MPFLKIQSYDHPMRTLLHGISLRRKLLFLQGISLIFTILSLIFILRIEN